MDPSLSAPTPTLDITGDGAQSVQGQTNQTRNDHAQLTLEQAVQLLMQERAQIQELKNRVAQIDQSGATTTALLSRTFATSQVHQRNLQEWQPSWKHGSRKSNSTWTCTVSRELMTFIVLAVARQFLGDQPSQWAR
jgi:hypothetical protein